MKHIEVIQALECDERWEISKRAFDSLSARLPSLDVKCTELKAGQKILWQECEMFKKKMVEIETAIATLRGFNVTE